MVRVYCPAVRRRILIPVGVVVVLVGIALVWWLKSSSDERAKTAKTASGATTPGARAKSREPAKPAEHVTGVRSAA